MTPPKLYKLRGLTHFFLLLLRESHKLPNMINANESLTKSSCVTGTLVGSNERGDMIKIIPLYCHKWTCSQCAKVKSYEWKNIAVSGKPQRFMTLTLKENKRLSAGYQAKIIKKAWTKLVSLIRKTFGSFDYMLVFELTKKGTPHIHVLQRGCFIPKKWLSEQWMKLTGAFIVDIRKIFNEKDVARYIMKYLGKALGEVSEELHGMRIIQRSKNWIIVDPDKDDEDDDIREDGIYDWYYTRDLPGIILEAAKTMHGFSITGDQSKGCFVLHGPPDVDICDKLTFIDDDR